ncbi:hypothetical protein SEA_LUZDEMUNDO_1 [Microbacterium phage LuzDeMundo]|nr:hypothetical protein SEA_LUZDEMUNDO_1 [Microbacterium phage LuzDeMundo]
MDHQLVIDGEPFTFTTAELAAATGYEFARDYPSVRIARYNHDKLVSSYSPNYGWV